jgi:hypothetical protein
MLNRSVPSFFHGKATDERPFCPDCDASMILSLLELDKPGFDLRTFACPWVPRRKASSSPFLDLRGMRSRVAAFSEAGNGCGRTPAKARCCRRAVPIGTKLNPSD